MPTEAEQIEQWRRQMDQEEEEEYAEEQRRADMKDARMSRSVKFDDAHSASKKLPAAPVSPARTQPPAASAAARQPVSDQASAAMQNFDWNAGAMAQLQEFGERNADLTTALEQKERELNNLKRRTELNELTGGIRPPSRSGKGDTDPRDAKIVELAKKNRAMSLQFEQERSKVGKLNGELKRANAALQQISMNPEALRQATMPLAKKKEPWAHGKGEAQDGPTVEPSDELKQIKLKLKESGSRLADQKVTNGNLKGELEKCKRLLLKEVGEGVALETLEGDGWRGRAQQISLLKDKLREGRRQLDAAAAAAAAGGVATVPLPPAAATAGGERGRVTADDRNRQNIAKIEKERRGENERLQAECQQKTEELAEARAKHRQITSRTKTVEKQLASLKQKLILVLEKSTHDDKLIAELRKTSGPCDTAGPSRHPAAAAARRKREGLAPTDGKPKGNFAELALKGAQIKRQEALILSLSDELRSRQEAEAARGNEDKLVASKEAAAERERAELEALKVEASAMASMNVGLKRQLEHAHASQLNSPRRGGGAGGNGGLPGGYDVPHGAEQEAPGGVGEVFRRQAEQDRRNFAELMEAKEEEVQLLQETLREQQYVYKEALAHIGSQQQSAPAQQPQPQPPQQAVGGARSPKRTLEAAESLSSYSSPGRSPGRVDPSRSGNIGELLTANDNLHAELEELRSEAASRLSHVDDESDDDTVWTKAGSDPRGN